MNLIKRIVQIAAPALVLSAGVLGVYLAALVWGGIDPVSFAFLLGYPFVAGAVILRFRPEDTLKRFTAALAWLMGIMVLSIAMALATEAEGLICIAIAICPILFAALLGGVLYLVVQRWRADLKGTVKVFTLPVAAIVLVSSLPSPPMTYEITDSILIDAPPAVVFEALKSIPDIRPEEIPTRLSHRLGVPKPTEARWIDTANGPVRLSFWGEGVKFRERITAIEQNQRIAWAFEFPEGWIAEGIEDPHVKVGGPHFDILTGEYRLELQQGQTRLSLTTRTYDASGLGRYAQFWHEFFFDDFHQVILVLVKSRIEANRVL